MGNSSNISIHFQLEKEAITVKGAKKRATAVKMLTWNNENLSGSGLAVSISVNYYVFFFVHQIDIFAVKLGLKF